MLPPSAAAACRACALPAPVPSPTQPARLLIAMRALFLVAWAAVASAQTSYTISAWATYSSTSSCSSDFDQALFTQTVSLNQCFGATNAPTGGSVSFMLATTSASSQIALNVYGGSTCSSATYVELGTAYDSGPAGSVSTCVSGRFSFLGYGYTIGWTLKNNSPLVSASIGIIVGASVGGLLVCCGIGLCVFFLIIRPRRSKTTIITSGGMGMAPVVNPAGGFPYPQQQMMMPQQQQQQMMMPYGQQQMMMPQGQQQMMMPPSPQHTMMPQQTQQLQMVPMSPQLQQQPQPPQPPQTPA